MKLMLLHVLISMNIEMLRVINYINVYVGYLLQTRYNIFCIVSKTVTL